MYSITDILAALAVVTTLVGTTLVKANESVETAKSFNPIAIEKIAQDNIFKYQNEIIQNGYLQEDTFETKEGYTVKVLEASKCSGGVKLKIQNKYVKTELTSCTKHFGLQNLKIEQIPQHKKV